MSLSAKDHFNYLRFPFPLLISVFGVFDYVLYGILTFMAILSVLVFIEECIYIYRKVPTNKKSVIIWVNGAAPVRRVCRKEKQMLLVQMFNCVFTLCFRHSSLFFRWLVPCHAWGCGSPKLPCLLICSLAGGSFFVCLSFSPTRFLFPTVLCVSLTSRALLWKNIVKPEPQNLQKIENRSTFT